MARPSNCNLEVGGVYISHPFCRQKCTYCNFSSGVFRAELERAYVEALLDEIGSHEWAWRPETVYVGGGSPDRLTAAEIRRLLAAVPGAPWREATLEASPGDFTAEQAAAWAECGINRVSLGVQSFITSEIRRTGRKHTAEAVAADVRGLERAGIGRINIDLIAGLPGQNVKSWRQSLGWVERLGVGHVSVYMLEVDDDSRLGREIRKGGSRYGAAEAPPPDAVAELYEMAVVRLASAGIERYEISNFARPGEESRHNLKYWRLEPYAGFGAGAHSCDFRTRTSNVATPSEYVERWRSGADRTGERTPADPEHERFFVGLRLREGIELRPEDRNRHGDRIRKLTAAGLLEMHRERLRLTGRGVLLSNEVFQEFLDA